MNAKQLAAQDLKNLLPRLKGVLELASDLDFLGQLEQTAVEAKSRVAVAKAEEAKVNEELEAARKSLVAIDASAKEAFAKSKDAAEAVVKKAHAEADAVLLKAKTEAENIVSQAKKLEMAVADTLIQKRKAIELLNAEIQEKSDTLTALKKEMVALRGRLG